MIKPGIGLPYTTEISGITLANEVYPKWYNHDSVRESKVMAIPSECRMPNLSSVTCSLMNRLIVQLMVGEPGLSRKTTLYRRNFIRLLDKALREYQEARRIILDQIGEANHPAEDMSKHRRYLHKLLSRIKSEAEYKSKHGQYLYIIRFPDHIESCISNVRQLYQLLRRIKSEKESPPIPRDLRRAVEKMEAPIIEIRDAIEHMEELIQKDKIAPGEPVMATVSEDGDAIVVSKYQMKFKDLAMVLKEMHEIAFYVLTIKKMEPIDLSGEIPE